MQTYEKESVFQTKKQNQITCACFYREKPGHKASKCQTVSSVGDRRLVLSKNSCTEPLNVVAINCAIQDTTLHHPPFYMRQKLICALGK